MNFLKVVALHGRLECLRSIQHTSQQMYREMQGRIAVHLSTATAVDDEVISSISSQLEAALSGKIDLETSVNADLIGGLVLRVGDTVYDGSVANQLDRMRSTALDQTNETIRATLDRFTITK
jgi:F-type H+-transporting ATPase subunit delta